MFRRANSDGRRFVDASTIEFEESVRAIYKNGRVDDYIDYDNDIEKQDDGHYYADSEEEPKHNELSALFDSDLNFYEQILQNKREQALEEFLNAHSHRSR